MTYAATVTTTLDTATDDQLDALAEHLAPHSGVPSLWCGRLSVLLTVDTVTGLGSAADVATALVRRAATLAELPPVDIVGVEVFTEHEQARRLDLDIPSTDLIPTATAGELLGVSRQRVLQLARDHDDFPASMRLGGRGLFWSRSAVLRFEAVWRHGASPPAEPAR